MRPYIKAKTIESDCGQHDAIVTEPEKQMRLTCRSQSHEQGAVPKHEFSVPNNLRVQPEVRSTANEELPKGSPAKVGTQQYYQANEVGVHRL